MDILRVKFKMFRKRYPNSYSIVIGAALVLFVRGVIGLSDLFLFPGSLELSYAASVILGLFLLYLNDFKLKELEQ